MNFRIIIALIAAVALIGLALTAAGWPDLEVASTLEVLDESKQAAQPHVAGSTAAVGAQLSAGEDSGGRYGRALAPALELTSHTGEPFILAAYRGQKPVVIDFWASWCHNCQRDMPRLSALYEQYRDQVEVVGVNLMESAVTVQAFVETHRIAFPIVVDTQAEVSQAFGIQFTNTHVLIDKRGGVAAVIAGDIVEEHITALIADSKTL